MKILALATFLGVAAIALADGPPPNDCYFYGDAGFWWSGDAGMACFTYTGQCGVCTCDTVMLPPCSQITCVADAGDVCPPGTPTATTPEPCASTGCGIWGTSSGTSTSSGGSSGVSSTGGGGATSTGGTAGATSGGSPTSGSGSTSAGAAAPSQGCSSPGRDIGPWLIAGAVPLLLLRRKRRRR